MESLLGSSGVSSCLGISNTCTLGLANQQAEIYSPTTKLQLIRFWTYTFGEIVWNLSTQVNGGLLAAYITAFDPRRGNHRRFIPFMVYTMVYLNIFSNPVTFYTLSPCIDSVCMQTCYTFSRKTPLMRYRTVETEVLINWQLALNIFESYQSHYLWTQELVKRV